MLALGEIAVHEPDALPEIRRELWLLAKAIPSGGHCNFGVTLAIAAQKIPFFAPDVVGQLRTTWLTPEDGDDAPPERAGVGRAARHEAAQALVAVLVAAGVPAARHRASGRPELGSPGL